MGENVEGEVPLSAIVDAIPASIAYVDREQHYRVANGTYRAWFGDVRGKHLRDVLGDAGYEAIRRYVERALAGARVTFEACMPFPDGARRWLRADYVPDVASDGTIRGFVAQILDINDRKLVEDRLALLAEASSALAASVDHASTLLTIAKLAVPTLAEWAAVYLDRFGVLAPVEVAHTDQLTSERTWQLARSFAPNPSPRAESFEQDGSLVIPLVVRGRRLGVLVLATVRSEPWTDDDIEFAEEIGRRSSAALDVARMFEQQRRANERLHVLDRRKNEFLAIVGHELRNPLAPIVTALDLMQYRGLTGFERECDIIRRQANHMARLVDDLLDVSRLTRGKIELHKEQLDLNSVIAKAIERTSPLLEQRAHQLTIDVPRDLYTLADRARLTQIFENLITNAAKYTHPRGHISIAAARRDATLFVTVSDDGNGIAPDRLLDIFEPFVQGERAMTHADGGLGIGLAIVRSLTELHGGRVTATSEGQGRGAQFTVELPAYAPTPALEPPPPRATGTGRLLLVDDNVAAADVLAQLLRELGYEVAVAHDAPAALALADQFQPSIALLDIGLPVMDGYELARHLRSRLSSSPPRLVAVTGYGEGSDLTRSRDAGFDVQLGKPVDFEKLVFVLSQLGPG